MPMSKICRACREAGCGECCRDCKDKCNSSQQCHYKKQEQKGKK
jgi:hypothetical protein